MYAIRSYYVDDGHSVHLAQTPEILPDAVEDQRVPLGFDWAGRPTPGRRGRRRDAVRAALVEREQHLLLV